MAIVKAFLLIPGYRVDELLISAIEADGQSGGGSGQLAIRHLDQLQNRLVKVLLAALSGGLGTGDRIPGRGQRG